MISVITPVYNASKFLPKTIESVQDQNGISEHILIDDGSADDSLEICQNYAKEDDRIIVLQHHDKLNHGRSATRNVGIKKSKGSYIAFLDADDFYLPNRFETDLKLLEGDASIDGVYNAIGVHYYEDYTGDRNYDELTTVSEVVPAGQLFENMTPFGSKGYFSGDGLIVRKNVFDKVGMFNESLEVAEDTELWMKMSLLVNLVGNELYRAVTVRGVHEHNVSTDTALYNLHRTKMYEGLVNWAILNKVSKPRIEKLWCQRNIVFMRANAGVKGRFMLITMWMKEFLGSQKLLMQLGRFAIMESIKKLF